MNALTRAQLRTEPVPVGPSGQPARACVVYEAGAWRTAWALGLPKEPFGPPYPTAREAAAASRFLNDRGGT